MQDLIQNHYTQTIKHYVSLIRLKLFYFHVMKCGSTSHCCHLNGFYLFIRYVVAKLSHHIRNFVEVRERKTKVFHKIVLSRSYNGVRKTHFMTRHGIGACLICFKLMFPCGFRLLRAFLFVHVTMLHKN